MRENFLRDIIREILVAFLILVSVALTLFMVAAAWTLLIPHLVRWRFLR